MPGYAGIGQAKLIRENRQDSLWNKELIPAGGLVPISLSRSVQLERIRGSYYPWGFSVEIAFAGPPGAFEVDVMVADTDNPAYFIQWTNITSVNGFYVGRVDVMNSWAKYVALYLKTLTNAVAVSAQITR